MRLQDYIIHCDGAIEGGNPGGRAVGGWVLTKPEGELVAYGNVDLKGLPCQTNNAAEYAAVFGGLRYLDRVVLSQCANGKLFGVIVHTDSTLVVKQLQDKWAVNKPELKLWNKLVKQWAMPFHTIFKWIPRSDNIRADAVSRLLYRDNDEWPKESDKYDYCSFKEGVCQ